MQEQFPKEYEIKKFDLPEMTHQEMDKLLQDQILCRITFHDEPYPYTIPMEYYYFGDVMYFHFTTTGKKMELIKKDPRVTIEVDWHNEDLSDYSSVIMRGRLVAVENREEKNTMNVAMASAVNNKLGIKAILKIPWGKKGVDYLSASNIPLQLYKLDLEFMTGKKAY